MLEAVQRRRASVIVISEGIAKGGHQLSSVTINIPTGQEVTSLEMHPGESLFFLGRNGTGKSALVQSFVRQLRDRAIYLPGSRPSYFDNESLSLTPASRSQLATNLRSWDTSPDTRWRSRGGTARNEKAIHDLTAAEAQFKIDAANEIANDGKESKAVARLQSGASPLDKVNALLSQSNLPITGVMERGELKALRDGTSYSIAKTSDGERAALVLIAEVVAAPIESIFIIDEPELHLHRAIVVPLINALMRERPDDIFLISTHELELPGESPQSKIVMVRDCHWQGDSIASWDIDVIDKVRQIPEDLRIDILGSRRKILFVEGIESSLDSPLYALLFPNVSVSSRESCREVARCVSGLRATEDAHNVQAFGLVDNDGMGEVQIRVYEAKGVYPLSVHAVESLYYAEELIKAVAERQSKTFDVDPAELIADATSRGLAALSENDRFSHLAGKVAEQKMRDAFLQHMPDRTTLIARNEEPISISVPSPYPTELARIKSLHAAGNLSMIIARYPVRESGILDAIAKALRFPGHFDYEEAALVQVGAEDKLREALREKLGSLAQHLV